MTLRVLVVAALVCATFALPSQTLYKHVGREDAVLCGNPKGCITPCEECSGVTQVLVPSNVTVEGCCSNKICPAKRGTNVTFTFILTADASFSSVGDEICAELSPVTCIDFPGFDTDMCKYITPSCPIEAGKTYNVTISIPIEKVFPAITTVAKWTISDSTTKKIVTCFEVPVEVV